MEHGEMIMFTLADPRPIQTHIKWVVQNIVEVFILQRPCIGFCINSSVFFGLGVCPGARKYKHTTKAEACEHETMNQK